MNDKTCFQVTMTTLSPLHIGSGERLREGFDFIEHDGYLWVADQGALMRAILDEATAEGEDLTVAAEAITGLTLYQLEEAGWLRGEHFDLGKRLFRYRLQGRTSTTGKQGELHEQIKDVYGRPYLPGSSLKGALRTLIAWARTPGPIVLEKLDKRRKFAARPLEEVVFASGAPLNKRGRRIKTANYDLLRALRVSDSQPTSQERLGMAAVELFPMPQEGQGGPDIDLEALEVGTVFQTEVVVDKYLFSSRAAKLRFQDKRQWLTDLAKLGQEHAQQRIRDETEYHRTKGGPVETLRFYTWLTQEQNNLAEDEFLLQSGWGAGWDSKTLGSRLRENPGEFAQIVNRYGLAEGPRRWREARRRRSTGTLFPGTRKLATMPGARLVRQPLGWVKIRVEGIDLWAEEEVEAERVAPPVVSRPEDLQAGMVLEGTVRNVTKFGAFVDIGVERDGLVHISELAEGYVRSVEDVVLVGQRVRVRVLSVERRGRDWRISLTMKGV